jgi:hypothetical protein
MLQSCHHVPSFDGPHRQSDLAGRSSQPSGFLSWPIAMKLRTIADALREGIAAHRSYWHLSSRGIPHATAIRQAFGISRHGR